MEFENGTWTSHGPEARARENEQRVEELETENKRLKKRIVELQSRVRLMTEGSK